MRKNDKQACFARKRLKSKNWFIYLLFFEKQVKIETLKHYIRIKRRESILIFLFLPEQKGKKNLSLSQRTMVSSIVEEEEVAAEVEAVQAVYGDDCVVLKSYPLHLLLKPRIADVTSQQVSLSTIFYICLVAQKTMGSKTKTQKR